MTIYRLYCTQEIISVDRLLDVDNFQLVQNNDILL